MTSPARRAQKWFNRINGSRHVFWLLAVASFLETLFVPIPIELVLIPLMVASRDRIGRLATVTTLGCVVGALVGYGVGMTLYQSVGTWFIEIMDMQRNYQSFQAFFDQYGFVAILALGILPIPFQIAMITAGASGYSLYLFVLAAFVARGIRYFGLAWLILRFGERAEEVWRQHALTTSLALAGALIAISLGMQALAGRVV
ncbi:YqaA family protein [Chromatocurvus halotolerans]|uniref:Membrane protein YqaA with SNARE-associated domain n=1 Tax=Chromatocurvus halotolerans TaxID=1132028 RepID=A0A4R2L3L6_9GAMM|nr:VTT domain-containing protein [Chromatocurvus halotolerans]TCO78539.1 membrane protein YqaA with SNARE-associated domain [Chromatocurvus halotolerans]